VRAGLAAGKLPARILREVPNEAEIARPTADCAHHRHGLRRYLLRDDDTKARGDLCQEADEEGSALTDSALVDGKVANFDQPTGEHRTNREIVGLCAGFVSRRPTEREYFEAG